MGLLTTLTRVPGALLPSDFLRYQASMCLETPAGKTFIYTEEMTFYKVNLNPFNLPLQSFRMKSYLEAKSINCQAYTSTYARRLTSPHLFQDCHWRKSHQSYFQHYIQSRFLNTAVISVLAITTLFHFSHDKANSAMDFKMSFIRAITPLKSALQL